MTAGGIWSGISIPPAQALNKVASSAADRQLAIAGEHNAIPVTWGTDRVGALILNVLPAGKGSNTLLVQCLWGHAVDGIGPVTLNDAPLPAGSTVTHYTGSQTSVDPALASAFAAQGVQYDVALTGYAYSVVAMPIKAFDGQLNISAEIRGRRVYDPRKDDSRGGVGPQRLNDPSTWAYSACAALAYADWASNRTYGAGLQVDWDFVVPVANANDQVLAGGEPRREIGLTLRTPASVEAVSEAMRAYAGCWVLPGPGGVIRMIPDADGPAVATYSHAAGQILALRSLEKRDISSDPTAVEVIYTDWTKSPPRDASAIAKIPGAGQWLPWRLSQVRMPGIRRHSQAMREATERLNKLRLGDLSTSIEIADEGIRHDRGDIIAIDHPIGLSNKPMRVVDIAMPSRGRWQLDLREHDPAFYSDTVETKPTLPDTALNNPAGPPDAISGLTLTVVPGLLRIQRSRSTELDWNRCEMRYGASPATSQPIPADVGRDGADWPWPPVGWITIWARDIDDEGQAGVWVSQSINVDSRLLLSGANIAPPPEWLNANVPVSMGAINRDPSMTAPELWQLTSGVSRVTATENGSVGRFAFSVTQNGLQSAWDPEVYPINIGRSYRLTARLKAEPSPNQPRPMAIAFDLFDLSGERILAAVQPLLIGHAAGAAFLGPPVADGAFREYGADIGHGTDIYLPDGAKTIRVGIIWFASLWDVAEHAVQELRLQDVTEVRAVASAAAAAQQAATAASSNASTALAQLATMRSNGYLDASEKPSVIRAWSAIAGEYDGIVAEGTRFGAIAERNGYTQAYNSLSAYLNGLVPAWNDTTRDTPIVPATDQASWSAYYSARQALLNRISALAKAAADTAQAKADAANSAAGSAQQAATAAQQAASAASASASAALAQLATMRSNGYLDASEKPALIRAWQVIADEQGGIVAEANRFGIVAERDSYTAAYNALRSYLLNLAPPWNDTSTDTPIVPATDQATWSAYYSARQALLNRVSAVSKGLADAAQQGVTAAQQAAAAAAASANGALSQLATMRSNGYLDASEKPALIRAWQAIASEQGGIVVEANRFGIVSERDSYTTAYNALAAYLSSLVPAWNDTTTDTPITPAVDQTRWGDYYSARQALLNRISAVSKQLTDSAQSSASSAAATANSALGQLATMRSNGYLDASEKPAVIKAWNSIASEKPGIVSQADAYGLVQDRNDYVAAYNSLAAYLNGLWPGWSDTTTDTPITPAVDQAMWVDYYARRQQVLNAIAAEAGRRSSWSGVSGRPKQFIVRAMGLSATPPAGWWNGVRNAESGAELLGAARSWMALELDRNGQVVWSRVYDVCGNPSAANDMASDLIWICANRKGNILVIYTYDEPQTNRLLYGLAQAIYACGGSRARFGRVMYRGAYILVGIAGSGEGNGAEVLAGEVDSDPGAWAELSFSVFNGALNVSGMSGGPRSIKDLDYVNSIDTQHLIQGASTKIFEVVDTTRRWWGVSGGPAIGVTPYAGNETVINNIGPFEPGTPLLLTVTLNVEMTSTAPAFVDFYTVVFQPSTVSSPPVHQVVIPAGTKDWRTLTVSQRISWPGAPVADVPMSMRLGLGCSQMAQCFVTNVSMRVEAIKR